MFLCVSTFNPISKKFHHNTKRWNWTRHRGKGINNNKKAGRLKRRRKNEEKFVAIFFPLAIFKLTIYLKEEKKFSLKSESVQCSGGHRCTLQLFFLRTISTRSSPACVFLLSQLSAILTVVIHLMFATS